MTNCTGNENIPNSFLNNSENLIMYDVKSQSAETARRHSVQEQIFRPLKKLYLIYMIWEVQL